MENFGIMKMANIAKMETRKAADAKDYMLRRKSDRLFKEVAKELANGDGYVIATASEMANRFPGLFDFNGVDSGKMIWAVSFMRSRTGNKMCFVPVR